MNQFLNKLEKKFGQYAIPDLIKYVVALYCAGAIIGLVNPELYYGYLSLDLNAVFHGQVWRLFTFLMEPSGIDRSFGLVIGIIFFLFQVNLFFLFGRSLEQAWGTFRFNMYFLLGYLFNLLAAAILYFSPLHLSVYDSGLHYIYWSMFFAFALLNPNMEFLLYGVLPIKVKWLAIFEAVLMLYNIVKSMHAGIQFLQIGQSYLAALCFSSAVAIIVAMANFLIFYFSSRHYRRIRPKEVHRRREFKKKTQQYNQYEGGARHRCAVCGRTELDDDTLDFRYCSKCDGNYEYCSEHLFTHQHVKKFM